ncbi:MAG: hypothetical protein WBE58_15180 [Verrucomicrobiales bacterium]
MTASLENSFLFSLLAENASSNLNSLRWLLWALLVGTLLWWLVWAILCKPETETESATAPDSNEPEDAAQACQANSQVLADAATTRRDAFIVPCQRAVSTEAPQPVAAAETATTLPVANIPVPVESASVLPQDHPPEEKPAKKSNLSPESSPAADTSEEKAPPEPPADSPQASTVSAPPEPASPSHADQRAPAQEVTASSEPSESGDSVPLGLSGSVAATPEATTMESAAAAPRPPSKAHPAPASVDHQALLETAFAGEPVKIDPELGIIYPKKPSKIDDLELIRGIGGPTETALYASGVYRFRQIAYWSDANVSAVAAKTGIPAEQIASHRWIPQAAELADISVAAEVKSYSAPANVDQAAVVAHDFAGEAVTVDPTLGILYTGRPDVTDSLADISGIDDDLAAKLQESGVCRFQQVAHWSDDNVASFAEKLGIAKSRIEEEKWIPQARQLHRDTYSASGDWGTSHPSLEEYQSKIGTDYAGEAVQADVEKGIVYTDRPSSADDLKQIKGIGEVFASRLNASGVHRFRQIAGWSEANVEAFAKECQTSPKRIYRDRWIPQAGGLLQFAGEDVRIDDDLGILYLSPPAEKDDLQKVKGIGPVIEKRLHEFGVYRYKQIANWSASAISAFSARLGTFKGRIHWDNWIGQTRRLHRTKYGD